MSDFAAAKHAQNRFIDTQMKLRDFSGKILINPKKFSARFARQIANMPHCTTPLQLSSYAPAYSINEATVVIG